jgi:hypothetical protein
MMGWNARIIDDVHHILCEHCVRTEEGCNVDHGKYCKTFWRYYWDRVKARPVGPPPPPGWNLEGRECEMEKLEVKQTAEVPLLYLDWLTEQKAKWDGDYFSKTISAAREYLSYEVIQKALEEELERRE